MYVYFFFGGGGLEFYGFRVFGFRFLSAWLGTLNPEALNGKAEKTQKPDKP